MAINSEKLLLKVEKSKMDLSFYIDVRMKMFIQNLYDGNMSKTNR